MLLGVPPLFGMGASEAGIEFVGARTPRQTGTILWPAGTQAGDLAVVYALGNSSSSGGGFSWFSSLSFHVHFVSTGWRVLTAGNISSPPSITVPSFGAYIVLVFRNATSFIRRSTPAAGYGSSIAAPGFGATAGGRLVALSGTRNPSEPTIVSGWTDSLGGGSVTYFGFQASLLASDDYGGGSVTVPINSPGFWSRVVVDEVVP